MANKKAVMTLFFVAFLVMMGFGIIIPVMPFIAQELGASPAQLGWLMATYSLMQFLFAPIWGKISDKIGRRPVMLVGMVGLVISFLMFAFAQSLTTLFIARIVGGLLSSANLPTMFAYVSDITSEEDRGKGMGLVGAATGLGFVFGPAIGGILSKTSYSTPFLFSAGLSAVTFVMIIVFLKESLPPEKRSQNVQFNLQLIPTVERPLLHLFITQFIATFALAGLETTFAYFANERAGAGTQQLGYMFMIMGLAQAVFQGGLISKMIKRFGEKGTVLLGAIVSAAGFWLILLTSDFWTAALFLTIFGIGNGVIRPSLLSLATKRTTEGSGSVSGIMSSFDSLARVIAPIVAGYAYKYDINVPFIAGGAFVILMAIYFMTKERTVTI